MPDGQIIFEIEGDNKPLKQSLNETTNAIEKESVKWDKAAGNAATGMETKMTSMFTKIGAAAVAAKVGQTLLQWGKDAIAAASDLEEVQNVVDVTFGESASAIDAWAKTAITQFGLTETQAKQFASTMGAMMKSAGMAGPEIVEMSENLAGLAADMASFYNMDFETAFQKIRSGIAGETEPLRQLGINMSVASLNAFALEKGLGKTFEQMSQGEQVTLRYQYLMQATADTQGDFARTSDGYANGLRLLESNIESIKTKFGEVLIPILASATSALNEFLGSLTQELPETVLDQFNRVDIDTEKKLEAIKQTTDEASLLIDLLGDLNSTGADGGMAQNYLAMGSASEQAKAGLTALGWSTDQINERQAKWLETCKRLVQTIPGLSEIINTQTGEVKGGIPAIESYVVAWEDGQRRITLIQAQEQRRRALQEKFAEMPGLEIDMGVAENRLREQKAKLDALREKYGFAGDSYDMIIKLNAVGGAAPLTAEEQAWNDEIVRMGKLTAEATKAREEYERQKEAYDEALEVVKEGDKYIEELKTETDDLAESTENAAVSVRRLGDEEVAAAQNSLTAFDDAMKALTDYTEKAYQSNRQAISNTLNGFSALVTPAEAAKRKMEELKLAGEEVTDSVARGFDEAVPSIENMTAGLASQLEHLRQYNDNLAKMKAAGFSADVLAMVSDGSAQSMDYAAELARNGSNTAKVSEVNRLVADVKSASDELASTMTENNLAVDANMQELLANYTAALEGLNQYDGAKENAAQTVQGVVDGLAENASAVQAQVENIMSMLAELSGASYNVNIPGVNLNSTVGSNSTTQVHTTINLDGTKLGEAVSQHQANTLTTLDRSGWGGDR